LVRIRRVPYWKRYMTKRRYLCKRYLLYLPVAIGDAVDTSLDYIAKIFGPAIVIIPKKGCENFFSRLENLEKPQRENATSTGHRNTSSFLKDSNVRIDED